MMDYTCYDCGKMVECETCGHEEWEEGIHYDLNDFPPGETRTICLLQ